MKILIRRKSNYKEILMVIMIMISMLTVVSPIWAVDYTSIGGGNWNDQTIWNDGVSGYPNGVDDTATIANGHTVRITADITCGAVTINSGGVVNHNTYNVTWIVRGNIVVRGRLSLGKRTTTKIDCMTTHGLYGIIVESGGVFNASGNDPYRNCIITTFNPAYNSYIYLKDGSHTTLDFCDISEMGTVGVNGIHIKDIDGNMPGEGVLIKDCYIRNSLSSGICMNGCSNNNPGNGKGIINNSVYGNADGIALYLCSFNTLHGNSCYDNNNGMQNGRGILIYGFFGEGNNTLTNNNCYNNYQIGISISMSNNNILNNNTCYNQSLISGIDLYNSENNQLNNNVTYGNPEGIVLNSSNNNMLIGHVSHSNHGGLWLVSSTGNELINCNFGTFGNNTHKDIFLKGSSTLTLKNCQLASTTEVYGGIFGDPGSWVISQKHDQIPGLVRIWGDYNIPAGTTNWRYDTELYSGSGDANVQK
ncbi:right-handed parallel beta-helix repeat-containing protein, partial [bacterium]|nr:right-handed parallel beta-helix repeat-containing protein [bacterium]